MTSIGDEVFGQRLRENTTNVLVCGARERFVILVLQDILLVHVDWSETRLGGGSPSPVGIWSNSFFEARPAPRAAAKDKRLHQGKYASLFVHAFHYYSCDFTSGSSSLACTASVCSVSLSPHKLR